jgi:acyl-coenzyme A thioesterase PaaI-like protein
MESDGIPADDEERAARRRAGRAVRDIGHALVGHEAPAELVEEVAATLDTLTGRLAAGPTRGRPVQTFGAWQAPVPDGGVLETFPERPVSGLASPWGCDLDIRRVGDEAVARFTLRAAHEGAPGRSHGGIVAAIFDDVMGFVIQMLQEPAFTGELHVRYEKGVPIGRELEVRTRLDHRHGRKIYITAEMWDGDERVCSAKSTFIALPSGMTWAGVDGR